MNTARGEVSIEIDGAPRRLCLTLGALAEIEGALAVNGLEALGPRMRAASAGDLAAVLAALLRGGGEDGALAARASPGAAARGVAEAFRAALL
ncbi:hypothetical protein ASG17_13805 [Brevundimonas sp. Leaf363]|uniref:GTA-gp10 family protein n=1 Tax=Brevundimonas sp. Leaf363 TaxID=1736353 RepID=UPI0006F50C93|nr:GTA-gp10 family protein [Brevundimonas sp. Leaf363]KQS54019.1 hypothetical protein ASG17_13805 [Brevundimonas sp. Leaf363]